MPIEIQRTRRFPVSGESMIKAHIMDGDTVAVRVQPDAENGETVASSGVNRRAA
ncbi:LexA family protein [Streptomyces geranii]|uniref:LexA family protein n=1 Tax=Streptomyces geranii TaxID=2058923 RepID=UPI001E55DE78|nr:S24 family peptidase [Streptomyces geranii]